jgi:hypothetical protein
VLLVVLGVAAMLLRVACRAPASGWTGSAVAVTGGTGWMVLSR